MDRIINNRVFSGFGACMISGYPFSEQDSFYSIALKDYCATIKSPIALGGFPACRAKAYLQKKALTQKPTDIILQFGSTDALYKKLRKDKSENGHRISGEMARKILTAKTNYLDSLKWLARDVGLILSQPEEVSSLNEYLSSMVSMTTIAATVAQRVFVLGPFVCGRFVEDRRFEKYSHALEKDLKNIPNAVFINARQALINHRSKSSLLLKDGFHLSRRGHEVIGSALRSAILQTSSNT